MIQIISSDQVEAMPSRSGRLHLVIRTDRPHLACDPAGVLRMIPADRFISRRSFADTDQAGSAIADLRRGRWIDAKRWPIRKPARRHGGAPA